MHTPFFALLICEQFKEASFHDEGVKFSAVSHEVLPSASPSDKVWQLTARVWTLPGQLLENGFDVGKVAFDRLKKKDLSYFEEMKSLKAAFPESRHGDKNRSGSLALLFFFEGVGHC